MKRGLVFILFLIATIVTGCAAEEEEALMDQSINVGVTKAYIGSQETEGTYIGVIENTESVSVVPLVTGTVDEVNYEVGDTVSAGAVLCHFDDTTARQNYAVAKTGLKNAQASLATAQANYNNTVASTAQNIIIQHYATDYKAQKDIEGLQNTLNSQGSELQNKSDDVHDAKDDLEDAEEELDKAKESGDEAKIKAAESVVDQAEKAYEKAKRNRKTQEYTYNGASINLQSAEGQRALNNGIVYQGQQVVAAAGMDVSQKNVASAAVGVESANNNIDSAEYQLSLYTVRAPIGGVIEDVFVEKNNFFSSGQVSFVISNPNSRKAVFHVADNAAAELEVGQEIGFDYNGNEYKGQISEIGVAVDETGLFKIKADIMDAPDLADGIYIKLSTVVHRSERKIMIPTDAVYFDDNQAYVYVEKDGRAYRRDVELDIFGESETTLSSGLSEGENVIATWSGSLKDGAEVRVTGEEKAGDKQEKAAMTEVGAQNDSPAMIAVGAGAS